MSIPSVLFSILTCNRFYYLRNCLESVFEFVNTDGCEILIVDNNTIDKEIDGYLASKSDKISVKIFNDRVPNELYRAMNYAIKHATKRKIPYIHFIQDDYQYLYSQPNLVQNVVSLFDSHKSIGQIQTNLVWKRKTPGKYSIIKSNGINYAVLQDKMLVDSGFTRTRIYKKIGYYPESVISYDQDSSRTFGFGENRYKKLVNGELWFGKKCKKIGYQRAISLLPNMTMMFDCAYVRKWDRFGNYFPPPNKYYIQPFVESDINKVKRNHDRKRFSFIEDMTQADGWSPTTRQKHNMQKIKSPIER